MEKIYLFGHDYKTPRDLHLALKRMLDLPDYYGCNADALNDCLGERKPVSLCVITSAEGDTAKELAVCEQVIRDNDGTVEIMQ